MVNQYRPKLGFYHPNQKGTGSAVRFQLVPTDAEHDGGIILEIARQKTVGGVPSFDWDNKLNFMLGFIDLAKMMQVFRGETESIDPLNPDRGIFHITDKHIKEMRLFHRLDPYSGYLMSVRMKEREDNVGDTMQSIDIFFNYAEALGLSCVIETTLGVIAFGVPKVSENA